MCKLPQRNDCLVILPVCKLLASKSTMAAHIGTCIPSRLWLGVKKTKLMTYLGLKLAKELQVLQVGYGTYLTRSHREMLGWCRCQGGIGLGGFDGPVSFFDLGIQDEQSLIYDSFSTQFGGKWYPHVCLLCHVKHTASRKQRIWVS